MSALPHKDIPFFDGFPEFFFCSILSYTAHYYNVRHNTELVSSFITANGKAPCMSSMAKIALFRLSCKPFYVFNIFFPFFLHSVFHLHLNSSIIDIRLRYFRSTIQKKTSFFLVLCSLNRTFAGRYQL